MIVEKAPFELEKKNFLNKDWVFKQKLVIQTIIGVQTKLT